WMKQVYRCFTMKSKVGAKGTGQFGVGSGERGAGVGVGWRTRSVGEGSAIGLEWPWLAFLRTALFLRKQEVGAKKQRFPLSRERRFGWDERHGRVGTDRHHVAYPRFKKHDW